MASFLFWVLVFAGVALFGRWLERRNHRTTGIRKLPDGKEYAYVIGDNLRLYGKGLTYYGLGALLPKRLPQIYLDSNKGGGRRARYVIDSSQRIRLEGDFDTFFQLYAPKDTQVLALSLMTPDVMWTLKKVAGNYDIELYRDQLHIISNKPVFYNTQRQQELLVILDAIGVELDQKLSSWTTEYAPATEPRLVLRRFGGIKLFGRFFGWVQFWWLGIWSVPTLIMALLAVVGFSTDRSVKLGLMAVLIGTLFVLLAWAGNWALNRYYSFRPYD